MATPPPWRERSCRNSELLTLGAHAAARVARKSFFSYGSMDVFQGDLSLLSGRSVVETCILPILLYGAENWCLSQNFIQALDSFLGELSKRLLKLPRWYSNTPASIVIGLGSARALCQTCWSIAEVKLEWKYCSKSQPSRTKQIESTSSDKDAKVRELTISL